MDEYYTEDLVDETVPKPQTISLRMITKNHLPADSTTWPQDKIVNELNKISHLRLDRENIGCIDNLELLGSRVTNVYLQHNCIQCIENLESLTNLRFLTLSHNCIMHVSGLSCLQSLKFLDLSHNRISVFDIDQFPPNLTILDLQGNPCTHMSDYRGSILQEMASLRQLDGEQVTRQERRDVGFIVSSDSEDDEDDEDEERDGQEGKENMSQTTTAIILRSLTRGESDILHHREKMKQLDDVCDSLSLPVPSARVKHS